MTSRSEGSSLARTAALFMLAALRCHRSAPAHDASAPRAVVAIDAPAGAAPAPVSSQEGVSGPIETAAARWLTPTMLATGRVGAAQRARVGGWSYFSDASSAHRLLLARERDHGVECAVFDLTNSHLDGPFPAPLRVSDDGLRVSIREAGQPPIRVLTVRDAVLHRPTVRTREGAALTPWWSPMDARTGEVYVIATDAAGDAWAGRWDLSAGDDVVAPWRLDFTPGRYVFTSPAGALDLGGLEGGDAEGSQAYDPSKRCMRVRLRPDAPPRCVARSDESRERHDRTFVGSAFWTDHQPEWIVDTDTGRSGPSGLPASRCQTLALLETPPRALRRCQARSTDAEAEFWWWAPGQVRRWSEPREAHLAIGDGSGHRRFLARETSIQGPVDGWVDMERGERVTHEALVPLRFSVLDGPEQLLTRRVSAQTELIALDVRARTLRVVARYADCRPPRFLAQRHHGGGRIAIACESQPQPDLWVFRLHWSEVIDLRAGLRWRMPSTVDGLLDDGRVVLSAQQTDVAEGGHPVAGLSLVALSTR